MRLKLYQKVIEKYLKEYYMFKSKSIDKSNYLDIAGNLVSGLNMNANFLGEEGIDKRQWLTGLKNLKTYLKLIDKFPEFKAGELTTEEGFFPDIRKYVYSKEGVEKQRKIFGDQSTHNHYILLAKERLNAMVSNKGAN